MKKRNLHSPNPFDALIPPPAPQVMTFHTRNIEASVRMMPELMLERAFELEQVAPKLMGRDLLSTCRNIWDWCYHSFEYKLDEGGEKYKSPAWSWQERHQGIDCDDFTLLSGCLLLLMRIPFAIKLVRQSRLGNWDHVYIVVPTARGYITIDPVLKAFNQEAGHRDDELIHVEFEDQTGEVDLNSPKIQRLIQRGLIPKNPTAEDLEKYRVERNEKTELVLAEKENAIASGSLPPKSEVEISASTPGAVVPGTEPISLRKRAWDWTVRNWFPVTLGGVLVGWAVRPLFKTKPNDQ